MVLIVETLLHIIIICFVKPLFVCGSCFSVELSSLS